MRESGNIVAMPQPNTLLELIALPPAESPAFLLTDSGIRVTYQSLRNQVSGMADALASMGIGRGDRVATALPNGLPAVVSFLAASVAGTAAPLNPGYREDEFSFYLQDTNAKVLLCPPEGADAARKGSPRAQTGTTQMCRWSAWMVRSMPRRISRPPPTCTGSLLRCPPH